MHFFISLLYYFEYHKIFFSIIFSIINNSINNNWKESYDIQNIDIVKK